MLTLTYTYSIFKRSNILMSSWFLEMIKADFSRFMEKGHVNTSRKQEIRGKECCYFLLYHGQKRYKACLLLSKPDERHTACKRAFSHCLCEHPLTRRDLSNHCTDFYNSVQIRSLFGMSCKTVQHRIEITRDDPEDWVKLNVVYVPGKVDFWTDPCFKATCYFRVIPQEIQPL